MLCVATSMMCLNTRSGEFTPPDKKDGEPVVYKTGEFYQTDSDTGSSMSLKLGEGVECEDFERMGVYDLTLDIRQFNKSFRITVIDAIRV